MRPLSLKDFESRTLNACLRERAEHDGDDTFVQFGDRSVTFGEMDVLARRYGNSLMQAGVRPGDAVAIFMENSLEMIAACFGINRIGATWIPTNTEFKGAWLAQALQDSEASVLLVDGELLARVEQVGAGLPERIKRVYIRDETCSAGSLGSVSVASMAELAQGSSDDPDPGVAPGEAAAVLWTSGTTGRPKGVVQSHHAWVHRTQRLLEIREAAPGDVFYSTLPLYNSGGWILGVLSSLLSGLPLGLDQRFSVRDFWDRCRFYNATQVITLGAMHMFLWQAPASVRDEDNPVRVAGCVPMPAEIIEPFKERFGLEYIWQVWGNSEVMIASAADRRRRAWKNGSAGLPESTMDVKILDDNDTEVASGEVGEICIRPRVPYTLFSGYYRQPEASLLAFRNLWFHSGDLGRLDEDGELFFVDRKADYMRYKGRSISSFEIETVLLRHPDVLAAAAHGVASVELASEDEIKVCVVRRHGASLTAEELAKFVNDTAPYYFVPRYIQFLDELPMTPTGRVQKFKLRSAGIGPDTWDRDAAGFVVVRA